MKLLVCDGRACPGYEPGAQLHTVRVRLELRSRGTVAVRDVDLCAPCWKAAGRPDAPPSTRAEVEATSAALGSKDRRAA